MELYMNNRDIFWYILGYSICYGDYTCYGHYILTNKVGIRQH